MSRFIYIILAGLLLCLVAYTAHSFAYSDGADLRSFLFDDVSFTGEGYEPAFRVFQFLIQPVAKKEALVWVPSFLIAVACVRIISLAKTSCYELKIFWLLCLVCTTSLVNFRVGSFILLIYLLPNVSLLLGPFFHWSYIFSYTSLVRKKWGLITSTLLAFTAICLISSGVAIQYIDKLVFYLTTDFGSKYGFIVPVEIIFLGYVYHDLYKSCDKSMAIQVTTLSFAFFLFLFGQTVPASRLTSLSVVFSLLQLRYEKIEKINIWVRLILIVVGFYQFLRFLVNINID